MSFKLTKNNVDYLLETDGTVASGGAAFGTWTVNATNQIVVTPPAPAAAVPIDVTWSFIKNQLCLLVGAQQVANFHSTGMPDYSIDANRIKVDPPGPSTFTFLLTCDFAVDDQLDLLVKIGTVQSTLVGILEDAHARFLFRFKDLALHQEDVLILQGEWQRDTSVDGEIQMKFVYTVGGAGTPKEIALKRGFVVNPFTNSLRLSYQKDGQGRAIELAGEIQFQSNTLLVFSIKKSQSPGVSTLQVNFQLAGTGTSKKLIDIAIVKSDGTTGRTLTISGNATFALGAGGMTINFSYTRSTTGGAPLMQSLAVNATFALAADGTITMSYAKTGTGTMITVALQDVKVGSVGTLSAAFILSPGNAVRGALAFSW